MTQTFRTPSQGTANGTGWCAPSRCQLSCAALQAAADSIRREDLRHASGQSQEGHLAHAWFLHPAPKSVPIRHGAASQCEKSPGSQIQALSSHWSSTLASLTALLQVMKANYVPLLFVRKLFTQIFSFINVQLFNSLLIRRECAPSATANM